MTHWNLYRAALCFFPKIGKINFSDFSKEQNSTALRILKKYRCVGATLCLFSDQGVTHTLAFGQARKDLPAQKETVYRVASVSKFVTALCAMRLAEENRLDLNRDVNDYLPFSLRHPKAPNTPLTMKMLLSHTAGIHDGADYNAGIAKNIKCTKLLSGDSFCDHLPGEKWEYSNFGAGIAGAVMEAAAGENFETLMQKTVFAPLGVNATFYPQKVKGSLADAYRILPPGRAPAFDAAARQKRPLPKQDVNAESHYALAHGNLCISAGDLCRIGMAGMTPGFLKEKSLQEMRKCIRPFGERANNLSQGIGTFILQDATVSSHPLYGHQGMAYGAVHGLFFDPLRNRGLVLLTSGAGEARRGVLADLNHDLLAAFLGEKHD